MGIYVLKLALIFYKSQTYFLILYIIYLLKLKKTNKKTKKEKQILISTVV